jgi:hypothetical protein
VIEPAHALRQCASCGGGAFLAYGSVRRGGGVISAVDGSFTRTDIRSRPPLTDATSPGMASVARAAASSATTFVATSCAS